MDKNKENEKVRVATPEETKALLDKVWPKYIEAIKSSDLTPIPLIDKAMMEIDGLKRRVEVLEKLIERLESK